MIIDAQTSNASTAYPETAVEREKDLGGKRLGAEEYYLLDPERAFLPSPLMAFRRENGRLVSVIENNRVLSPPLNLEIIDTGKSFRLFDPREQKVLQAILTGEEEIL
jgi:hypothetical protein